MAAYEFSPEKDTDDGTRLRLLGRETGITRRRLLRLLSAGGAVAMLASCTGLAPPTAPRLDKASSSEPPLFFKETAPFINHGNGSLEARLENMEGLITPNRVFFVRNNSESLDVNAADWRLSVEGDAIANPLELTYEDVLEMPSRTFASYLECAGNHRAMFDQVKGRAAKGTQWRTGAVGNGIWTGAALRDVLLRAGITKEAVSVNLIGLDSGSPEGGFQRSMPVEKAMDQDTLLAYEMNGKTLPKDHGFPLRVLAPGWVGAANIKWLGRIVVSSEKIWSRNNTTSYTLIGDSFQSEGEALGVPVTKQTIKSALALPWPAVLVAGENYVCGYAQSPSGPIVKVAWSLDSGATWNDTTIEEQQIQPEFEHLAEAGNGSTLKYSWTQFGFTWHARPGAYTIMTRATDVTGTTQPDEIPFNEKGYLFNEPVPHPIRVAGN